MKMKNILLANVICAVLISCTWKSEAQQNPMFTQYMFNGLVLNPAYAGSHESMTFTASTRLQWTGIKGAPQTEVLSMHTPLKFSRSAAGGVFIHDKVGVSNQYMFYATYAYRIPVSEKGKIAVGAQAGGTYYRANLTDLNIVSSNGSTDPLFAADQSRFLPNFGIGAYYYDKTTYVGLSLPTLVNNRWENQDARTRATQQRHYYLTAGHVFDLSPDLKLKPNVLLKWVESGPFQYDINANLFIQNKLWVGVSYRMQDSIDGLFELNITDQFSFGYSYGYPISALASVQSGTHEIVLNYRVKKGKHIVLSPRYF